MNVAFSSLRCLQINLRHSKAAAQNLSQLILDLDIDVLLIQEPYASFSPWSSKIEVKNVLGYSCFHNLSSDHAFGAAIIVKSSLHATQNHISASNSCCGIVISPNLVFFSLYCRHSLGSIPSYVHVVLNSIPPILKPTIILGGDVNARNKIWNSSRTDDCGLELKHLFRENSLSLSNIDVNLLPYKPTNTSFLDVTAVGDRVRLSDRMFLKMPSHSDHPFISFSVARPISKSNSAGFLNPPPSRCNLDLFYSSAEAKCSDLPFLCEIESFNSESQIDEFLSSLNAMLTSSIKLSLLPFHPSQIPGRMPWWSKSLWAMRHNLRNAYKLKNIPNSSEESIQAYKLL